MKTIIIVVAFMLAQYESYPHNPEVQNGTVQLTLIDETKSQYQPNVITNQTLSNASNVVGDGPPAVTKPNPQQNEAIQQKPSIQSTPSRGKVKSLRGTVRFSVNEVTRDSDIIYVRMLPQRKSKTKSSTPKPQNKVQKGNPRNVTQQPEQTTPKAQIRKNRGSRRHAEANALILRSSNENNKDKGYKFSFNTSNKIMRHERLVYEDTERVDQPIVYGGYEYTDPEGGRVIVTYTAGIFGFIPTYKYIKP